MAPVPGRVIVLTELSCRLLAFRVCRETGKPLDKTPFASRLAFRVGVAAFQAQVDVPIWSCTRRAASRRVEPRAIGVDQFSVGHCCRTPRAVHVDARDDGRPDAARDRSWGSDLCCSWRTRTVTILSFDPKDGRARRARLFVDSCTHGLESCVRIQVELSVWTPTVWPFLCQVVESSHPSALGGILALKNRRRAWSRPNMCVRRVGPWDVPPYLSVSQTFTGSSEVVLESEAVAASWRPRTSPA